MSDRPILILLHGLPPRPDEPVSGMGLRAWANGEGLRAHGIEVLYATRRQDVEDRGSDPSGAPPGSAPNPLPFHGAEELEDLIAEVDPAAILVEAADEATRLPEQTAPVVLDLFAPRLLERQFQGATDLEEASRLMEAIGRSDYFLFSNVRQRDFHLGLLAAAGVDCRRLPAAVVPLSCPPGGPRRRRPKHPILVTGGVFWPWNDARSPLRSVVEYLDRTGAATLRLYGGPYPVEGGGEGQVSDPRDSLPTSDRLQFEGFLPYDSLLQAYARATLALDLAMPNLERELSFSFRHLDYLQCGLPMVLDRRQHAAQVLSEAGAAVAVDVRDEASVIGALERLLGEPDELARMGRTARKLARDRYAWATTTEPLATYCGQPRYRERPRSPLVQAYAERNTLADQLDISRTREDAVREQLQWAERRAEQWENEKKIAWDHFEQTSAHLASMVRSHEQLSGERDRAWEAHDELREQVDSLSAEREAAWEAHAARLKEIEAVDAQRGAAWAAHGKAVDQAKELHRDRERAWKAHEEIRGEIGQLDQARQKAWEAHDKVLAASQALSDQRDEAWRIQERTQEEAHKLAEDRESAWGAHQAALTEIERLHGERTAAWKAHEVALAEIERLHGERTAAWEAHEQALAELERMQGERTAGWEAHDQALLRAERLEEARQQAWAAHDQLQATVQELAGERDRAWQAERTALAEVARCQALLQAAKEAHREAMDESRAALEDQRTERDRLGEAKRIALTEAENTAGDLRDQIAALEEERSRLESQLAETIGWRLRGAIDRIKPTD